MTQIADRTTLWTDLLTRIASKDGPAVVWKNVEAGLSGEGDVDVMAARSTWEEIETSFRRWASDNDLGAVAVCRHIPGTMYLIAVDTLERVFLQLDVKDRATFRGATVFQPDALKEVTEEDARGFRRLRPGAEGLFKLVINGISSKGRPDPKNLAKERVRELLSADEEGYRRAARLLGSVGKAAAKAAADAAAGGWDRRAMARVEAYYRAKAASEPQVAFARVVAKRAKRTCPIIKQSLRAGRRVPEDVGGWVDLVAETHAVYKDDGVAPEAHSGRGAVLSVVGPDGSGKTTLIDALLQGALAGRPIMRIRKVGTLPRRTMPGITVTEPHKNPPYPFGLSYLKTAYVFCDYFLGWWLRIRPFVKAGGWVIVERGWWDIAVDPKRYRMSTPSRLLWALGRLQPLPDLLLILEAPAEIVHTRKQELSMEELDRQMRAWRKHLPVKQKSVFIDAVKPVDDVVRAGEVEVERLRNELEGRVESEGSAAAPRFVLPSSPPAAARAGLRIYHPMTPRGLAGWSGARALAAVGLARLLPVGDSAPEEVTQALAPHLREGMRLAVATTNHEGRYVALGLDADGGCEWVAKVATGSAGALALRTEALAVRELAGLVPAPLSPPRLLHEEAGLLLFAGVAWKPRLRPWYLPQEVAAAVGGLYAAGAEHGDFAPWNLYKTHSGWALLDWEEARRDPTPYLDLLHFLVQGHALLGHPGRKELLNGLGGKGYIGRAVVAYANAAGLGGARALDHLAAYLKQSMDLLDEDAADGRRGIEARRALLLELGA